MRIEKRRVISAVAFLAVAAMFSWGTATASIDPIMSAECTALVNDDPAGPELGPSRDDIQHPPGQTPNDGPGDGHGDLKALANTPDTARNGQSGVTNGCPNG